MSRDKINKRLEKVFSELNSAEAEYDVALPESSAAVFSWETDSNGLYTACDEGIEKVLGIKGTDAIGNPFLSFHLPADEQTKLREILDASVFPAETELDLLDAENKVRHVRLTIYQKLNNDKEVDGYRGYCEKIEELETPVPEKKAKSKKKKRTATRKAEPKTSEVPVEKAGSTKDLADVVKGTTPLSLEQLEEPPAKEKSGKKRKTAFSIDSKPIGTAELSSTDSLTIPMQDTVEASKLVKPLPKQKDLSGLSLIKERFDLATSVWTAQAQASFDDNRIVSIPSLEGKPAILALPLNLRNEKSGVIEILDDHPGRVWTEEDKRFLQEVAHHLGLALENTQLYTTIQRELSERVKAEREALRRNKDLSNLNQISQQLNQLASRQQIFDTVAEMTQKIMSVDNVLLALPDKDRKNFTFPICLENGIQMSVPARPIGEEGYQEEILRTKKPLLINKDVIGVLKEENIDHSTYMPYSLLAVPLLVGENATGVLSVFDYQNEESFDQVHIELLSSVAAQVATALENTKLFSEVTDALELIENRQRVQSNVANAVAELSQKGSKDIQGFLAYLAKSTLCERAYYAEGKTTPDGNYFWQPREIYHSADADVEFDDTAIQNLLFEQHPNWISGISKKGWYACQIDTAEGSDKEYLSTQHIKSLLVLGVKQENLPIGFLAVEHYSNQKVWEQEEIDILRTASEAFSNTLLRENLLDQLRTSLSETENLYSASHQMALANNMQEMIAAVLSSSTSTSINQGEVILFDYNLEGRISRMTVASTYSSESDQASRQNIDEYEVITYEPFFSSPSPIYIKEIQKADIPEEIKQHFLKRSIRSMAMLPLWSANVQVGVLLLQSGEPHHFSALEKRSFPPLVDQMSTAIQNLRLFESTQIALAETELLYRISSGIASSSGTEELVTLVGQNALPKDCDLIYLYIVDDPHSEHQPDFRLAGSYSGSNTYFSANQKVSGGALPVLNFPSKEPVILENPETESLPPATLAFFRKAGLSSLVLVPLQTTTNPVGFLMAGSSSIVDIDPKEAHILQIIGNSISVAIERHRLLFEAQRRALELQAAAEIARDTTSTLSQDILLKRIVNLLKDRFGFYHCSIFLLDEANQYAVIQESTGNAGEIMKKNKYHLAIGSKSVIGSCIASGQAVIVNDSNLSPVYYPNPLLPETRSEMGLPLKIGGRIIGALDLHSTTINAFSENELTVLQILTDQISVAIENARAFSISQKAVQEMRELDRVKSQFLANMSHELRTPLNSVIGFSRVILKGIDGPINKVQEQDITSIYNSGMNLLNMINEILDLSKIEAGKMELHLEDVDIADVINKAVTTATGLVMDKPIELVKKIAPDLPPVKADEIKIGQVVLNLLSNAIKFTEKGKVTIEADLITGENLTPEIIVTVSDSGVGIAAADQPKLFQRFSQVDDSPTRKTGGTGLGLSISRSLIEMHGGKIGLLSSTPGQGSVFYFSLPITDFMKGLDISRLGHGKNVILSIDDDPQVIALYERYLKNYGFEVVALTNPADAIEKAVELQPFAITLDIMMPQVDGWQVLNELKLDERTRDIPILVCSIIEDEEKGYSLGAAEYLVKPFLQDDLINAIHRINRDNRTMEVLVIDDDPDDLKFVKKMVETEPSFHPTLAQGGKSALEILKHLTPDLIILDLFMPDMNGFELLDHFKTDPRLSNVPVIVLTGADLTPEQKAMLSESSRSLATNSLLKESDILKNMEEVLEKIKSKE